MARATLSVQNLSVEGTNLTFTAPNGIGSGNGNTFTATDGRTFLIVNNGGTNAYTITLIANGNTNQGFTVSDKTYTVPSQAVGYTIWINPNYYSSGGVAAVDISGSTNITWAAVSMPGAFG